MVIVREKSGVVPEEVDEARWRLLKRWCFWRVQSGVMGLSSFCTYFFFPPALGAAAGLAASLGGQGGYEYRP